MVPTTIMCYIFAWLTNNDEGIHTLAQVLAMEPQVILQKSFDLCGVGSVQAWGFLFIFNFIALILYWWPGKTEYGPVTVNGHIPEYTDNGVAHCFLFTCMFIAGSKELGPLGWYEIADLYYHFPQIIGALNIFGLLFCLLLYFKGLHFPSGADSGSSGKGFLFDYYWVGKPLTCPVTSSAHASLKSYQ